jgi:hypothetical protein
MRVGIISMFRMFRGNENENAPETGLSRFPPVIEKIRGSNQGAFPDRRIIWIM